MRCIAKGASLGETVIQSIADRISGDRGMEPLVSMWMYLPMRRRGSMRS